MIGLACTTFNVRTEEIDQFGKLIGSGIISCSISPSFQDLISGHLIKNFLLKLLIIIYFRVINQQYQSPIKSHDVSLPIVMNGHQNFDDFSCVAWIKPAAWRLL